MVFLLNIALEASALKQPAPHDASIRSLWQYVDNAKNNPLFFIVLQHFSCHPKVACFYYYLSLSNQSPLSISFNPSTGR